MPCHHCPWQRSKTAFFPGGQTPCPADRVRRAWLHISRSHAQGEPASAPPGDPVLERVGRYGLFGIAAFFSVTFLVSVVRFFTKYGSEEEQTRRKVGCEADSIELFCLNGVAGVPSLPALTGAV
jgi:hypothetical protein